MSRGRISGRGSFRARIFFGLGGRLGRVSERLQNIERLKELLLQRAVQFGEFTLASGRTSDVYVDGRLLTLSPEGSAVSAELLYEKIAELKPDAVGGMTMGADPIVGALVHLAGQQGNPMSGFLVRKEPKGHGTKRSVEIVR